MNKKGLTREQKIENLSVTLIDNVKADLNDNLIKFDNPLNLKSLNLALIEVVYSLRGPYDVTNKVALGYMNYCDKTKEEILRNVLVVGDKEKIKDVKESFEKEKEALCDYKITPNANYFKSRLRSKPIESDCGFYNAFVEKWRNIEKFQNPLLNSLHPADEKVELIRNRSCDRYRSEIVEELSFILKEHNVNTLAELKGKFESEEGKAFEKAIFSVYGIGYAGVSYLKMLSGIDTMCKPDQHLRSYVLERGRAKDRKDIGDRSIHKIMEKAVEKLTETDERFKDLTVRQLDYMIWKSKRESLENKKKSCCFR